MDFVVPDVDLTAYLNAPNSLLTTAQVAELLQVTDQTLHEWRRRKVGPSFIKLSGRQGAVRYLRVAVARFLAEKTVVTNQHVESAAAE
jgi:hypothetical protein